MSLISKSARVLANHSPRFLPPPAGSLYPRPPGNATSRLRRLCASSKKGSRESNRRVVLAGVILAMALLGLYVDPSATRVVG